MSDAVTKKIQLTNNLTLWAASFSLPAWIVQIFRENGLGTVEEVGEQWINDVRSFDKMFSSMELTQEFIEKITVALREAENYYKQQKKANLMSDNSKLRDLEVGQLVINEENNEYRRGKPSKGDTAPPSYSSPASRSRKEIGPEIVPSAAESIAISRTFADEGEKASTNRIKAELVIAASSERKRTAGTSAAAMDVEPTALSRSSSGRDDSKLIPAADFPTAVSGFSSTQVDLQEWISEKQIPSEIAEGLTIFSIFTTGMLAEASDEIVIQLGEKVKPIPRKKFLAAMKDLKQKLGVLPSEQPLSVPEQPLSVPVAATPSIIQPSNTDNHYAIAASVPSNLSPVSAHVEEDIGGEMILISTEIDLSIEDLRKLLEYENNIIETLIQLTVNSREKFSDKALETMNQSKLDHQDRAKRIKKLILQKRAAFPADGEESKPTLTRGRSSDGETGSLISHYDSTVIPSDPAKSLSFNLYTNSHSVIRSADFRRTRDHISLERLKLNGDTTSSQVTDPNAATVRKSETG
jgi:hypothetical protein